MAWSPLREWRRKTLQSTSLAQGRQISEEDAFDVLCAQCLSMEQLPEYVVQVGIARGWYERIRMIAEGNGWDIKITIKDKNL